MSEINLSGNSLMLFKRFAFACSFLLVANCAHAHYCGGLPKNSAAFYSCEALNQQERFEQERKQEQERAAKEQRAERRRDQFIKENREREKLETEAQEQSERAKLREEEVNELMAAIRTEAIKNSGNTGGNNKSVPKFADYGTDMASLQKYVSDVDHTSNETCRSAWKEKESADAAYCLARHESGSSHVVLFGADAKPTPMLIESARLGHPMAQYVLAEKMYERKPPGDSAEIAKLIRASASSGIPHAQVTEGWWHMTGQHGFKVDYVVAMKWNLKAYKQGHSEGANNIGELYEKGLGVPKNIDTAKSWYRKASVLGNAEATTRLEQLGR